MATPIPEEHVCSWCAGITSYGRHAVQEPATMTLSIRGRGRFDDAQHAHTWRICPECHIHLLALIVRRQKDLMPYDPTLSRDA